MWLASVSKPTRLLGLALGLPDEGPCARELRPPFQTAPRSHQLQVTRGLLFCQRTRLGKMSSRIPFCPHDSKHQEQKGGGWEYLGPPTATPPPPKLVARSCWILSEVKVGAVRLEAVNGQGPQGGDRPAWGGWEPGPLLQRLHGLQAL